ncbi:DUF2726 domain-containing protein [Syntrophomonas wolfei]|uniref:DUF2726 domain-containing protein n=1 Tax=Syntrophomonas wolfei TaxID=863 RepID=UPI00077405DF|nr:DUF2726 domain-containing protein [Syntrophomonas wolfei]
MGQAIIAVLGLILAKLILDVVKENISSSKKTSSPGPIIDLGDTWVDLSEISSRQRESLLSKEEILLFQMLDSILVNSNYQVFPKVRLADLLTPNPNIPNRAEYKRRLRERVVDLLIVEKQNLKPLLLILTKGWQNKKAEPDQLSIQSIETAGLRYLIIKLDDLPSSSSLLKKLREAGLNI